MTPISLTRTASNAEIYSILVEMLPNCSIEMRDSKNPSSLILVKNDQGATIGQVQGGSILTSIRVANSILRLQGSIERINLENDFVKELGELLHTYEAEIISFSDNWDYNKGVSIYLKGLPISFEKISQFISYKTEENE